MSAEELDGPLAPPMANGEVVFEAPWQGRVFGMARALCEAGLYSWDEFRAHLIREIGTWQPAEDGSDSYAYFDHFQRALERQLADKGVLGDAVVALKVAEFAARPHGHDH